MGLEGPFPYNLSVSLGSTAVTPINLTEAYTTFARGGSWINHRIIRSIQDAWGENIAKFESESHDARNNFV